MYLHVLIALPVAGHNVVALRLEAGSQVAATPGDNTINIQLQKPSLHSRSKEPHASLAQMTGSGHIMT